MSEKKVVPYSSELFNALMASQVDYWQTGETVCGAEDPAVITIGPDFHARRPEYSDYSTVRVLETYVSPWKSDTYLEFSNEDITPDELERYDALTED